MPDTLTIFYNTRCPVCDAGINAQQNKLLQLVKSGRVEFRDINLEPDALQHRNASLEDIRKRLHALDNNTLLVGADVPLALWRLTPGRGWLASLLGNPVARPITRLGYNLFAEILYAWNKRKGQW